MNEAPPPFAMSRVFRLARKELREVLRDRRTIITLIAMPLMLYPLMSVAFQQFYLASSISPEQVVEYRIGTLSSEESSAFEARYDMGMQVLLRARALKEAAKKKAADPNKPTAKLKPPRITWTVPLPKELVPGKREQLRAEVRQELLEKLRKGVSADPEGIDLIVEMPSLWDLGAESPKEPTRDRFVPCKIIYIPSAPVARAAVKDIEAAFAAINTEDLRDRLKLPNAKKKIHLLSVTPVALDTGSEEGIISLAALVPLVLLLMTITGAVYPAIDVTAGERERGTLEILVAAPVSRIELLSAKYVTVLCVAILTAIVNLVCMAITVSWSGLGAVLIREGGFSALLLLQLFGLLLLFAGFFSAVLLCLTSFARSFKEAQAYLVPLMLGSLTPGILAMMPGLKLDGMLTVLPLVNIVLLARDLFDRTGDAGLDPLVVGIVVMTTMLYALTALSLAARVFGAESVLYSEQSGWSDLLRRPDTPQPVASVPMMLWCLALMVPVQFLLQTTMRQMDLTDPLARIGLGVLANLILFGLLPALFVSRERVALVTGLGLTVPRPAALAGAALLGVSLWPLELFILSQRLSPGLQQTERFERFGAILREIAEARDRIGWAILISVIVPAILEEFFFRGLLFNALKRHSGALVTIGANGLLFGVTHVILGGALGLDRLFPSLVLGLILASVCWWTGSVWPCVLQHVLHNALLLFIALYSPGATRSIPWHWLVWGAVGAVLGVLLVWGFGRQPLAASRSPGS